MFVERSRQGRGLSRFLSLYTQQLVTNLSLCIYDARMTTVFVLNEHVTHLSLYACDSHVTTSV